MRKKILIIGGCGYIGSRLISFFNKKEFQVKILDNEMYGDPTKINNYNKDFGIISSKILKLYDHIIFLAAHSSVKACNEDIDGAINNNIIKTKNLIDKSKKISKLNFIFASSAAIYNGSMKPAKEKIKLNLYQISFTISQSFTLKII